MDRALLVGINVYAFEQSLSGCVSDVNLMTDFLITRCGFSADSIRPLTDERATRAVFMDRLQWFVKDVSAGDRLVFHYSGHGSQLATRDPQGEVDFLDEVLCPTDFHNGVNAIRDKELHELFATLPPAVNFVWIADCCCSGDLTRSVGVQRFIPPHHDIQHRIRAAHERGIPSMTMRGTAAELNVAFVSACDSGERAEEVDVGADRFGALTINLVQRLSEHDGFQVNMRAVVEDVVATMKADGLKQNPQFGGTQLDAPFPAGTTGRGRARLTEGRPRPKAARAKSTDIATLEPGDVLLYRSEHLTARLIQALDGTPFNHASLYLGDGFVGEAVREGVVRRSLSASGAAASFVMARRLPSPADVRPVLARASTYLGQRARYAYEEILLLAILTISRRVEPTPVLGRLIRRVVDGAASTINRFISDVTSPRREPMICSEFVARCYNALDVSAERHTNARGAGEGTILDALNAGVHSPVLRAAGPVTASLNELIAQHVVEVSRGHRSSLESVAAEVGSSVRELGSALHRVHVARGLRHDSQPHALEPLFATVEDFVTPGDLYRSTGLIDAGVVANVENNGSEVGATIKLRQPIYQL
jgi:hypothetical protein